MSTLLKTIVALLFANTLFSQEIKSLEQNEIDSLMHLGIKYNFDTVSPIDFLRLAISVDDHGCLSYFETDSLIIYICSLDWKANAKRDWLSDNDIKILIENIESPLPCIVSKVSHSSRLCSNKKSTLGEQINVLLVSQKDSTAAFPGWCSKPD